MKITPETKTLATIFQFNSDNKYLIPVYQRNYSWKDEQIETLFDDILAEDTGYYVGNLLINSDNGDNNVIDGQQRLTTLSLMLLATYEKLSEYRKEMDNTDPSLDKLIQTQSDIKRQLLLDESDDDSVENKSNVRLVLLDKDQQIWEDLVKVLNYQSAGAWGRHFLYKRYKYINEELFSKFESANDVFSFYKKLSNIELLQISVPELSDAYQVFASLNSKGVPLTPLDLLKNVYLSMGGQIAKWQQLQDVFTDNENEDIDTAKITSFVLNNYDAFETTTTSSLTKGKIVKEYEKIFKKTGSCYIDTLIKRAKLYNRVANNEKVYSWSLSGLAKLDATTSYPLVLNLLENQEKYELTDEQFNQIIADLIKLYVMRNIALTPKASNMRAAMNNLRKEISESDWRSEELIQRIHDKLVGIQPKFEAVKLALQEGIYDKNKRTARFILIVLEREFGKYFDKATVDTLDEYDNNKNLRWSIEHIIPQGKNLSDSWKDAISPTDRGKAEEIQIENVHKLGNLTLTPYNSEMGNRSFEEKKNLTIDGKLVGLSLGLFLNESIDKNQNIFGIDELQNRQEILESKIEELFLLK